MIVYIGTYTKGESQGIYVGDLDLATGRLALTGATMFLENPSFVAVDPHRLRLYAVSEVNEFEGRSGGVVSAFALDPRSGALTLLNSHSSGGAAPCHVSVDPAGRFVLAANYSGGSVALLPLDADGRLAGAAVVPHVGMSVDTERQREPHAHFITLDPAGRHALAVDLGTDSIEVYEIMEAEGRPTLRPWARTAVKAGAGPRHLAFHPSGRYVYVINELNSTLTAWQYDAEAGRLLEIQNLSTLPDGCTGPNSTADVHVHPSGRFMYGSNRGHDSLAVFAVEPETGRLARWGVVSAGGRNPRGFAIDPTGAYLLVAHQDTNTVSTFQINQETGDLTPTGERVSVPSPVCVKLLDLPVPVG